MKKMKKLLAVLLVIGQAVSLQAMSAGSQAVSAGSKTGELLPLFRKVDLTSAFGGASSRLLRSLNAHALQLSRGALQWVPFYNSLEGDDRAQNLFLVGLAAGAAGALGLAGYGAWSYQDRIKAALDTLSTSLSSYIGLSTADSSSDDGVDGSGDQDESQGESVEHSKDQSDDQKVVETKQQRALRLKRERQAALKISK